MGYKQTTMTKYQKRKPGTKWGTSATKRSRYNQKRFTLSKSDYGFPDKFSTKLRYAEVITFTAGAGAFQANTFRLNSVYDPNLSGVGHQPMYHDQLALIYGKYRVNGARIRVRFEMVSLPSTATASYAPTLCGIVCSANSSFVSSSYEQLLEQNNNQVKVLGDKSSGNSEVIVTQTFSPSRDLGNGAVDDSNAGSFGNNPSQVFYAHVFKNDMTANPSIVQALVEIEYQIEVYQRLEIGTS